MCNTYIRSNNLARFRYNHTVQHGDRFLAMPDRPLSKPMTSFPTCWESYFKKRMAEEYQFSQRGMLPWEFLPASTFLLSQVTTCLHGMYQHDRDFFTTTEELTIHVLGPSQTFECKSLKVLIVLSLRSKTHNPFRSSLRQSPCKEICQCYIS